MADDGSNSPVTLTEHEQLRYNRQLIMPGFGEEGQRRLKQAHVMVAGVGGLGSPVAIYLAAAGIGRLSLIDFDAVSLSNLNRQILHWEEDIDRRKVISAEEKLARLNSTIDIRALDTEITAENLPALLQDVDVVMDCMDNMKTRFLINRACNQQGVPLIHGGVQEMMGEVTTIVPGKTACLECVFPSDLEKKETFPIIGATAGMVASIQVLEAVKLLTGMGTLLTDRMLFISGSDMEFIMIDLQKKAECRVCGGLR